MNRKNEISLRKWRLMALICLMFAVMPSFGQGTIIVRPGKKTETKNNTKTTTESKNNTKTTTESKKKDKTKSGSTKTSKPSRSGVSYPTIVHSQQWAIDRIMGNMVRIEGGKCLIGVSDTLAVDANENNGPAHEVTLSPFYIGKYEVTEEEWQLIMGSNPSDKSNGMVVSSSCPVDNVSWEECQEFVKKLAQLTGVSFRLPTEAEWEFAARGGETIAFPYSGAKEIDKCGWYVGNSSRVKHPVGQKNPNQFGLYDMTGNVREWCKDIYGQDYYANSPSLDPQGPAQGSKHVIRGGSFNNQDDACVVSYRSYSNPDNKNKFTGLRLAYSVE